jgi:nucleoside-diphosphate-sugar epimerase
VAQTALVLGGTGLVGTAVACRLAERGWEVAAASRGEREAARELRERATVVTLDRADDAALAAALGEGVDVLIDCVAMRAEDGPQLVSLRERYGSLIVFSSASVYTDRDGRSFDEATGEDDFPVLPVPISERQPTVAPGDTTYSTRKAAIERSVAADPDLRATIIRPGAVYGPHDIQSREWYFVKRALDGRPFVVLAFRGGSRFHPTAVDNLAELVRLAAERPGARVLNCADPEAPAAVELGRAIGAVMDYRPVEVLLPGPPRGSVGDHPWGAPRPFVLDTTESELVLGYRPVTRYERAVEAVCAWLQEVTAGRDWRESLPGLATHYGQLFDYEAEDAFLAAQSTDSSRPVETS